MDSNLGRFVRFTVVHLVLPVALEQEIACCPIYNAVTAHVINMVEESALFLLSLLFNVLRMSNTPNV